MRSASGAAFWRAVGPLSRFAAGPSSKLEPDSTGVPVVSFSAPGGAPGRLLPACGGGFCFVPFVDGCCVRDPCFSAFVETGVGGFFANGVLKKLATGALFCWLGVGDDAVSTKVTQPESIWTLILLSLTGLLHIGQATIVRSGHDSRQYRTRSQTQI